MLDLRELWEFRELLYFLVWRDVKVRYKQTVLGALWAVLQPALFMVVFTLIFGRLAHLPSDGVPYPVFVYAGLLPWTFFATAVTMSSTSLVNSANLITKIYFPRMIVPLAAVGVGLVDLVVASALMAGLLVWYHVALTPLMLLAPVFMLGVLLAATGIGALLAALTVTYRDFRYIVPFAVQLWMYATPVVYAARSVPHYAVAHPLRDQPHDRDDRRVSRIDARAAAVVGSGRNLGGLGIRLTGSWHCLLPACRTAVRRCRLAPGARSSSSST